MCSRVKVLHISIGNLLSLNGTNNELYESLACPRGYNLFCLFLATSRCNFRGLLTILFVQIILVVPICLIEWYLAFVQICHVPVK